MSAVDESEPRQTPSLPLSPWSPAHLSQRCLRVPLPRSFLRTAACPPPLKGEPRLSCSPPGSSVERAGLTRTQRHLMNRHRWVNWLTCGLLGSRSNVSLGPGRQQISEASETCGDGWAVPGGKRLKKNASGEGVLEQDPRLPARCHRHAKPRQHGSREEAASRVSMHSRLGAPASQTGGGFGPRPHCCPA